MKDLGPTITFNKRQLMIWKVINIPVLFTLLMFWNYRKKEQAKIIKKITIYNRELFTTFSTDSNKEPSCMTKVFHLQKTEIILHEFPQYNKTYILILSVNYICLLRLAWYAEHNLLTLRNVADIFLLWQCRFSFTIFSSNNYVQMGTKLHYVFKITLCL